MNSSALHLTQSFAIAVLLGAAVSAAPSVVAQGPSAEAGVPGTVAPQSADVRFPDALVNQDTTGGTNQVLLSVAASNGAGFAAVWRDQRDGMIGIYLGRMNAHGELLEPEHPVHQPHSGRRLDPTIALGKDNSGAVVWVSAAGGTNVPWVRTFDANGKWLSVDRPLTPIEEIGNTHPGREAGSRLPVIAALPHGGYAVAWTQSGQVKYQELEHDGAPHGKTYRLAPSSPPAEPGVQMAVSNRGSVLCVWRNSTGNMAINHGRSDTSPVNCGMGVLCRLISDPVGGFWGAFIIDGQAVLRHLSVDGKPDKPEVKPFTATVTGLDIALGDDYLALLAETAGVPRGDVRGARGGGTTPGATAGRAAAGKAAKGGERGTGGEAKSGRDAQGSGDTNGGGESKNGGDTKNGGDAKTGNDANGGGDAKTGGDESTGRDAKSGGEDKTGADGKSTGEHGAGSEPPAGGEAGAAGDRPVGEAPPSGGDRATGSERAPAGEVNAGGERGRAGSDGVAPGDKSPASDGRHTKGDGSASSFAIYLLDREGRSRDSSSPIRVPAAEAVSVRGPRIVSNGKRVLVCWTDQRNGDQDIYARVLEPSAAHTSTTAESDTRLETERRVNTDVASADQNNPRVAGAGQHAVIAWQDGRDRMNRVFARLVGPVGFTSEEFSLPAPFGDAAPAAALAPCIQPAVAIDQAGNFAVVWMEMRGKAGGARVQCFSADKKALSAPLNVDEGQTLAGYAIASLGADRGYMLAWFRAGRAGLWTRLLSPDLKLTPPIKVADAPDGDAADLALALLDDQRMIFVWDVHGPGDAWSLRGHFADSDGAPKGDDIAFEPTQRKIDWQPCVAPAANNGFVVGWCSGSPSDAGHDVMARVFDARGKPAGPLLPISYLANEQDYAQLVRLPDKTYVIAWEDDISNYDHTYMRRIMPNARELGPIVRINELETKVVEDRTGPQIAVLGDGLVTAWNDRRRSQGWDIYLRIVGPKFDDVKKR